MIRCGPSSDTIIILSTDMRPREISLFIAAACYARGKHKHGNLLLLFVCGFLSSTVITISQYIVLLVTR